jgi:hypothetical protein
VWLVASCYLLLAYSFSFSLPNNYKAIKFIFIEMVNNKRAQLTLFVIVAIILAVSIVLIWFLMSDGTVVTSSNDPSVNFQSCVEDSIVGSISYLLENGGLLNPPHSIFYLSHNYTYLCYTADYYNRCYNYYPFLEELVENQIYEDSHEVVESCFSALIEDYERQGYEVTFGILNYSVDLLPGQVRMNIEKDITISNDAGSESFSKFGFIISSKFYDLIQIVNRIVSLESVYCYFDVNGYMMLYPGYDMTRREYTDSKVYEVKDRDTLETFKFAVRSCPFAPGV